MNKLLKVRDPKLFNIIRKEYQRQRRSFRIDCAKTLHPQV